MLHTRKATVVPMMVAGWLDVGKLALSGLSLGFVTGTCVMVMVTRTHHRRSEGRYAKRVSLVSRPEEWARTDNQCLVTVKFHYGVSVSLAQRVRVDDRANECWGRVQTVVASETAFTKRCNALIRPNRWTQRWAYESHDLHMLHLLKPHGCLPLLFRMEDQNWATQLGTG